MKSGTLFAYCVTFTASFCIMVIELVAGRILAPYIGQHLYSWTSIIGVCLGGISIGAWLGGWLADKFPRRATLGWFLFFSGLLALAIPLLTDHICRADLFKGDVSLMTRIVLYTTMIFLPVTIVLGMISPMVIKLVVRDLSNAGSVVGRIYSFSTIGSILGTFATGFFLIEEFGTRTLLYAVGAILIVMAPLAGGIFYSGTKYVTALLVMGLLGVAAWGIANPPDYRQTRDDLVATIGKPRVVRMATPEEKLAELERLQKDDKSNFVSKNWARLFNWIRFEYPYSGSEYYKESNYFTLRVEQRDHVDRQTGDSIIIHDLILDNLIHSHSDLTDPNYLAYDYLRIYEELVGWHLNRKGTNKHRQLFIGGGGYTLQRMFHNIYKDSHIDVVEIDPSVTYVAEEYMGVPKNDPRLYTKNEDGRLFVLDKQKTANDPKEKYDFIFGDAFNDLSIPFHLTTLEFDQQLKNLLTPKGLVMSLVIDHVAQGKFLPSFIATMRQAFGDDNVVLVVIEDDDTRKNLLGYLKDKKLDQYIPQLTSATLDEVAKDLDPAKYAREIKYLRKMKQDEFAPFIKPTELDYISHSTVIVVASPIKQDWDDFEKYLKEMDKKYEETNSKKRATSRVFRPAALSEYLSTRTREPNLFERLSKGTKPLPWTPIVLTDDYAPVDNLTAPMFERRYGFQKQNKKEKEAEEEDDMPE